MCACVCVCVCGRVGARGRALVRSSAFGLRRLCSLSLFSAAHSACEAAHRRHPPFFRERKAMRASEAEQEAKGRQSTQEGTSGFCSVVSFRPASVRPGRVVSSPLSLKSLRCVRWTVWRAKRRGKERKRESSGKGREGEKKNPSGKQNAVCVLVCISVFKG